MTELIITPNYDKKTARFKGTIAGGESVKVTIVGAANWLSDGLRLRVVCGCTKTVAMFPLKSEEGSVDSFKVEGDDLIAAPLELNTIQARLHTQGLAAITATFIVEDVKNNILYFQDSYELHGWIKRCGDDEPYDLTKFPGLIDEWTEQIDNMEVSAKRVDNGVEIVAWDGKGEKPAAVMLRDGAKGDQGNPLTWDDLTDEQKASLKGNKGDKGDTAAHDLVPCDEDGKFYRLVAVKNENGEMVLALEQEAASIEPNTQAVLTTTDQTIDGVKIFLKKIKGTIESADTATKATQDGNGKVISNTYLQLTGGIMSGGISSNIDTWRLFNRQDGGRILITSGVDESVGATLFVMNKNNEGNYKGGVWIRTVNQKGVFKSFLLLPSGICEWDGKNIVRSVNGTNADAAGNVVIPLNFVSLTGGTMTGNFGIEKASPWVAMKLTNAVRAETPSERQFGGIEIKDKNGDRLGYITIAKEVSGDVNLQLYSYDPNQESGKYNNTSLSIVSAKDGNSRIEINVPLKQRGQPYSVIQNGTLSSGTSVTFASPFRDTNYIVLKADGSAISGITKTTSGFTLSAASTFNWIAIGAF